MNTKSSPTGEATALTRARPSTNINNLINYRTYLCPGCSSHYDSTRRGNYFYGRNPLVLNCKHTICEECLKKFAFRNNKIVCLVCQELTEVKGLSSDGRFQHILPFNYYLMGLMYCTKQPNMDSLQLSSSGVTIRHKRMLHSETSDVMNSTEKCCILTCRKPATLKCIQCNDNYCSDCCITVHQSVPFLGSHKTEALGNAFSVELEKCSEHNGMDIEFYCNNCEVGSCCYCFLEKHEGHERTLLSKLNDAEMMELNLSKEKAVKTLKQLMATQKKVRQMDSCDTSEIESKIGTYFANLHARLYYIERKLRQQIDTANPDLHDMGQIYKTISSNIVLLKQLLSATDSMHMKKYNLKSLLAKLKECDDLPCYLINQSGKSEPYCFSVDPAIDQLESYFTLNKMLDNEYILVSAQELPEGYKQDSLSMNVDSDTDSEVGKVLSNANSDRNSVCSNESHSLESSSSSKQNYNSKIYDEVIVTHIDTVDCFYIQRKYLSKKFNFLMKDIAKNAKQAPPAKTFEINELYLVPYVTKSSKEWCRGRYIGNIGGNIFKMFLIDFGNTISVPKDKVLKLSANVAHKKPFAFKCKLLNPTNAEWSKDAHLHMAQIISNKPTYMYNRGFNGDSFEVKLMISTLTGDMTSVAEVLIVACKDSLSDKDNFKLNSVHESGPIPSRLKLFKNSKKFEVNDNINVVITHIRNPHKVYIQINSYRDDYQRMMRFLCTQFRKLKQCIPVAGSHVIVEHKLVVHGDYHRAEILEVDSMNKIAYVFFVDLGYSLNVQWSDIRVLSESFAKLECQAIHVKLAHTEPLCDEWADNMSLEFIHRYIISEDVLKMVVHKVEPLEVALFELQPNVDICINALFVKKGLAKSTGKISKTVEWEQVVSGKEEEDTGFMFIKQTQLSNVDSDEDEFEDEGIKQPVDVIKAENPDLIYIKFSFNKEKEQQLYEELQVHYTNEREYKDIWNVGDKCVIIDIQDNEYCRGTISEKVDDKYKVYLYDKVEERMVPQESIFLLNSYFNKYHDIVFKCHLGNIMPAGDKKQWSNMAIEYIQDIFKNNKNIFIKKIKSGAGSIPVEMWYAKLVAGTALEPSQTQYKSINKLLVNAGLALKKRTVAENKCTGAENFVKSIENIKVENEMAVPSTSKSSEQHPVVMAEVKSEVKPKKVDWNDLIMEEAEGTVAVNDWLPPFKLVKTKFDAYITCADFDGILYIHDVEFNDLYKELEQNMKKSFDEIPHEEPQTTWLPGQMCTIHYEKSWYRGRVLEIKDQDNINVFMIDFGSDHIVSTEDLQRRVMFTDIPAFATKVKLHQVYPRDGVWNNIDYQILLESVSEYAQITVREGLEDEVPLVDVYTDAGVYLNDVIVQKSPNLTRLQKVDFPNDFDDKDDEDVDKFIIELDSGVAQNTNPVKYGMQDSSESLDVLVDSKEEVSKAESDDDGNSDVEELDNFQLAPIPPAGPNGKVKMNIINVIGINKVVVDVLGDGVENADQFDVIGEDIKKSFEKQPLLETIEEGVPCICPFAEDGNWYRAQIHSTDGLDLGFVLVFFVDYGNIDSVCYSELRQMKPEWFTLPVRYRFANVNVELTDENYKEHVSKQFSKFEGKSKLIEVISDEPLTIQIYDEDTEELSYQQLIDKNILSKM